MQRERDTHTHFSLSLSGKNKYTQAVCFSEEKPIPVYKVRMTQFGSQHFDQQALCKCFRLNNLIPPIHESYWHMNYTEEGGINPSLN